MAGEGRGLLAPRTERGIHTAPTVPRQDGASRGRDDLDALRVRIRALVGIAAENRSTMSPEELQVLLPPAAFANAEAVVQFIQDDRVLGAELIVADREVALRAAPGLIKGRQEQRRLTDQRLRQADLFAASLERCTPGLELMAISGSVAYGGTKVDDDIDFYIVTGSDGLWITLLIAMGLARLHRLRRPETPVFCFNRLEEADGCRARFRESGEALFAREALSLRVLRGAGFYRDLLESAPWMERWFPALYRKRVEETGARDPARTAPSSPLWRAANATAFLVVGPYLWTLGAIRNRRLRREGRTQAVFRTVVEPRFCAYESRKYDRLDDEYRRAFA